MTFRHRSEGRAPAITFAICCALALAGYDQPPRSQAHATPQVPDTYARQPGQALRAIPHPLPMPEIAAASAIIIDAQTGEVLFEHNADERRAPASTTKIMTGILALEQARPTSTVMVSEDATKAGGSLLNLSAGEVLPVREVIEATMIRSGNDGAAALAESIGGSQNLFIHLMNSKATELGMLDTTFMNPHGMPMADGGNISTARDLAILAKYAMQNDDFRAIVSKQEVTFPAFGIRRDVVFNSTNKLLAEFPLCTGIKTGYTNLAGHCLVAAARFRDREVIGVILGSEKAKIRPAMVSLFDYGLNQLSEDYWIYRKFSLEATAYPFETPEEQVFAQIEAEAQAGTTL